MRSAHEPCLFRVTFQRVVPANAGTHTARTLVLAVEQRPLFTFEARGDGSLRSQGRPAESLCETTTASTRGSIQSYAIPLPTRGGTRLCSMSLRVRHRSEDRPDWMRRTAICIIVWAGATIGRRHCRGHVPACAETAIFLLRTGGPML